MSIHWEAIRDRLNVYERLMRLDKPIGILLLLWPTLWGLWFSAQGKPNGWVLWIFILGTVLMRSAGCVINDYADRNFDPHVARTRLRPLAAGEIRGREAFFLAICLVLLAFVLILPLNNLLLIQMSLGAVFLATSYPFTKRFLAIPQAYLGLAFGFGIPMAYAAHVHSIPAAAWYLFLANVFWVVAYDTEYAMVDREDDLKIGIKTSAITFGRFDVLIVMFCYAASLAILGFFGLLMAMGLAYYLGLLVAVGICVFHYFLIRRREPVRCFQAFLHNNWIGASVFLGIVIDFSLRNGWPFSPN